MGENPNRGLFIRSKPTRSTGRDTGYDTMEILDPTLNRFPELKEAIQQRFINDPVFREVCGDYAEVLRAQTLLHGSSASSSDCIVEEYRSLLQELETEIYETLQRHGEHIPPDQTGCPSEA